MTARKAAVLGLAAVLALSPVRRARAGSPASPESLAALPSGTAPATHPCRLPDEAFEPLGESSGIAVSVERRAVEPRAVRARVELDAPAGRVLAVVADVPSWSRWIGRIRSLVRLHGEPLAFHVRFGAPWPASDRDYAVLPALDRASPAPPAVFWTTDPARLPPRARGVVRVTDLTGGFVVEALGGSRCRVVYTERVGPGGSLPAWALRRSRRNGPAEILAGLARFVEEATSPGQ